MLHADFSGRNPINRAGAHFLLNVKPVEVFQQVKDCPPFRLDFQEFPWTCFYPFLHTTIITHDKRLFISSIITAICFFLARMLSANSAGGKCSKSSLRLGFLISRLTLTTSPPPLVWIRSAARTFQARSFSTRLFHQSKIGWNSSN